MANAAELIIRITGDVDHVSRSLRRVADDTTSMADRLERGASRGFGALERWAKRGAAAAAIAVAGIAAGVASIGMAYEDSLNTFEVVSSATADQMALVAARAKELGNDLTLPATSAADAAAAMTELAKAGLSVEQSMDAAKGVLQLAAAAGIEEAQAAEYAASALNAFQLEGKHAVRVADLLAGASVAAMGEITDMGDALKMSAAVFNMYGLKVEDLVTAIAMMAQAGIQGSDAGTSLKQAMLMLTAPTEKAATLIDELGIRIYDAEGRMKPFREIIDQVTKAVANMGEEERNAALKTIFGADAVRAAGVVFTQGAEKFDEMAAAVTRQGVAAEVAAAKTKGLRGAWESIQSTLETGALTLYAFIAPPVTEFLRGIAKGLNMLADDPGWQRFSDKAKTVFQPVLDLIDRVGRAMQEGGFRAGFDELRRTIEDSLGGLDWNVILDRMLTGLQGARDKLMAFGTFLLDALLEFLRVVDWASVSAQLTTGLVGMVTAVDWAKLTETAVVLLFVVAPQIIDGFIRGILKAAAENPLDFVMLLLAMGFTPVKVLGALTGVLGRIPIIGPLMGWVLQGFGAVGRLVTEPIKNIFRRLGDDAIGALRKGLDDFWQTRIAPWLGSIDDHITGFFSGAGNWLVAAGRAIIQGLWNGAKSIASDFLGWVGSLPGKIISLKGPLSYDRVMLVPAGEAIMQGLMRGMQAEETRLTALLKNITTGVESTFTFAPPPAPAPMVSAGATASHAGPTTVVLQVDRKVLGQVVLPEVRDGLTEVDDIDPGSAF